VTGVIGGGGGAGSAPPPAITSGAAVAAIAAQFCVGVSVDRSRDHAVRTLGLMLVDDRGAVAVMTHPAAARR
jgi:hypothetical protein